MTTYDAITNRTTVWVWIRRRRGGERLGYWKPLFWFHGPVGDVSEGRPA